MAAATSNALSPDQVARFHEDGFLAGPFQLCTPDEMAAIRDTIDREVFTSDPTFLHALHEEEVRQGTARLQWRHLDRRIVYDLCAHPAIVEKMASIHGPDLLLWRSLFWVKQPGGPQTPWHQDWKSWPMLNPVINITAWIAITEATLENSCMQLIPGSHRTAVPEQLYADPTARDFALPTGAVLDTSKAVPVELKPGEFFLLDEKILHYAAANQSAKRRVALTARVTVPAVKVDNALCFPGHKVIVLSGSDRLGLNETASPPTT
ncbi:MAG TPA: phytanoyl-CoA dioxygenase family protein [Chloroflexota bacterium]|nr:phytanoyl-CoA dioxygenase family protein [Chloroflexota bacterium]